LGFMLTKLLLISKARIGCSHLNISIEVRA
jgi:hypothetical protein